jgi:hypothetical protein
MITGQCAMIMAILAIVLISFCINVATFLLLNRILLLYNKEESAHKINNIINELKN